MPFSIDDLIDAGVFLTREQVEDALERIETKKNIVLQGPPGVGKTFLARKLAFALMEEKAPSRVEFVQFHQSFSYEDFIRGFRPLAEKAGTFGLQDGVFFRFCQSAADDPDRKYVFIIDEVNRGNISQIFGELLMLIESDKRAPEFSVPLMYMRDNEPRFHIPPNLYIIGLMNNADRSLALVDYALRRRFAFVTLKAQYESPMFRDWLKERNMSEQIINLITSRMGVLNQQIATDALLGENYQVGHSFFCPRGDDFSQMDRAWYDRIIDTEIAPLLAEYWFDNPDRVSEACEALRAP